MRVGIWNQGAYAGYPEKPEAAGQVVPRPGRGGQAPAARRGQVDRPTRTSSATGSPTSSAPPSSTAAATRPSSTRPTACSARRPRSPPAAARPRRPPRRRPGGGRRERRRARRRRAAGRDPRARAAGDRRRQRARAEGAGGDPGGLEVHRHRLQVGRLDAADRLRLLGPDAVGLRAVRRPDPARHLHADRGAQRRRDRRPRRAEAGRPRVLRRQRRRPPRRHVPRRRQVPARAAHRRRGQGLEPERAVLRGPVRGRAALRRRRAGVAAAPVAAPRPSSPPSPARRSRRRAAAPAIDPTEVAKAQAAVARDAAEVRRNDSQLFQAIKAVESPRNARSATSR